MLITMHYTMHWHILLDVCELKKELMIEKVGVWALDSTLKPTM